MYASLNINIPQTVLFMWQDKSEMTEFRATNARINSEGLNLQPTSLPQVFSNKCHDLIISFH